ncbi:hypothetical protein BCR35DRAFT_298848 [Leucosporidium creatinivorum]|uniref:Uncharacterized protein n=1 Tax=Leucosporidium creatinivorum TaxID=106004 RepID=A0A1Y2G6I4_9BASI|nr:hypothetical protein BCR35DRAFT_298848 [Leucosporidium creatinivorum]
MKLEPGGGGEVRESSASAQLGEDEQLDERRRERRIARVAALEDRIALLTSSAAESSEGGLQRPSTTLSSTRDSTLADQRRTALLQALVDRPTPRPAPLTPLSLLPLAHSLESIASIRRDGLPIVSREPNRPSFSSSRPWEEAASGSRRPKTAPTGRRTPSSTTGTLDQRSYQLQTQTTTARHEIQLHHSSTTPRSASTEPAPYHPQPALPPPQHAPILRRAHTSPRHAPYQLPVATARPRHPLPPSYPPPSSAGRHADLRSVNLPLDAGRQSSISTSTSQHLHHHQPLHPPHPHPTPMPHFRPSTASPTLAWSSTLAPAPHVYPSPPSTAYSTPAYASTPTFSLPHPSSHPPPPPALAPPLPAPPTSRSHHSHDPSDLALRWYPEQPLVYEPPGRMRVAYSSEPPVWVEGRASAMPSRVVREGEGRRDPPTGEDGRAEGDASTSGTMLRPQDGSLDERRRAR